mgnify:CR=1 FL=1
MSLQVEKMEKTVSIQHKISERNVRQFVNISNIQH